MMGSMMLAECDTRAPHVCTHELSWRSSTRVCLAYPSTAGYCEQRKVSTRQPQAPVATAALLPSQPSLTTGTYSVDLHAVQHESTALDVTLRVVRVRA